jgi:hypothetical protein
MTGEAYAAISGYPDTGGIYRSTDLGGSWIALDGLPAGDKFRGLAFSPDFQELYVGVIDHGVYRTSLVSHSGGQLTLPTGDFNLHPNYPNPFNGSTVIQYEIATVDEVDITVYDIIGKKVFTVLSGRMPPGRHSIRFDAYGLPSGTYLCRMSTASRRSAVTKMLIIR